MFVFGALARKDPVRGHGSVEKQVQKEALAHIFAAQQYNVPETEDSAKQMQGFCNVEVREHLQSKKL